MLSSRLTSLHLLICAAIAAPAAASSAQEPMLAKGGQAEAAIVIAPDASEFARWLAGELAGHLQKLSGADLPIVTADKLPAGKPLVVLGGPQANPLAAAADQKQLARFADLKLDGFVLKRIELDGVPVLLAGGNDEAATMYAVYELLERLGIVFQLTGDIIPQKKPDLPMPPVDVRMEPVLKYRGMHCCHGLRWYMGLDDCELHMQLNAMMYDRDEIISGAAKYGLAGIVGQLNKERGLEANVRYIAEGAWNPEIDHRSFHEDYLSRLFGPDARNTLLDAFLLLGENDKALGWHGRSAIFTGYSRFSPVAIPLRTAMVGEAQPTVDPALLERETGVATATQERWIELGTQYRKALQLLRQARPKVLPGAQAELDYVIFKTESFAGYHDVLAAGHEAVAELNRALLAKVRGDAGQTLSQLEQAPRG